MLEGMRVAIVYESMYGNTRRVAEAVGAGVRRADADAEVQLVPVHEAAQIAPDAVDLLRRELIARALLVTPNLAEAAALAGASLARNEHEMEAQAREILALGARNVLIKGGHGEGDDSVDLLIGQGEIVRLSAKRIATKNTHGTGCTLSSAIAARLAKGRDVVTACQEAKAYVTGTIAHADELQIGHGSGSLNHFYAQWREP